MGRVILTLPRLGETMEEAKVTEWLVLIVLVQESVIRGIGLLGVCCRGGCEVCVGIDRHVHAAQWRTSH